MKWYSGLFLILLVSACHKDTQEENAELKSSAIIGLWQIVAESYSIGGPLIDVAVNNGGVYNFRLEGTFDYTLSNDSVPYYSGKFDFQKEHLILNYNRKNETINQNYSTNFEANNSLTLIPFDPICIEGCSTTLKKLE